MNDDPCAELKEALDTFQADPGRPTESLLDEALALVELARQPRFRGCSARICAHDKLIQIRNRIDAAGHAAENEALASRLRRSVEPTSSCFACLSSAIAEARLATGKPRSARRFLLGALDTLQLHPLLGAYYGAGLLQQALFCLIEEGTDEGAEDLFERIEAAVALARAAAAQQDHPTIAKIHRNLEEHLREARVLVALARRDPQGALEAYHDGLHHDAPSPGRLEVQVALLSQLVHAGPREIALLSEALDYAIAQRRHRQICVIALAGLSLDVGAETGCLTAFEAHLPHLSSQDLRQRAEAMGVI